jgi:hypothetical protein
MKQYLAVFIGTPDGEAMKKWNALDEKAQKERTNAGMDAWGAWVQRNEKNIVTMGSPLGKTIQIDPKGLHDFKNAMTAFTVVQADSHQAAAKMFENHPHFSIFPGESIEVMECLPIPEKK